MTTDPTILKAQARLAEIEVERQELTQFLVVYRRLGGGVGMSAEAKGASPVARPAPRAKKGATQTTPASTVIEAIRALLRSEGHHMKSRDILDHLTNTGIVIGGKKPRNTLGAILSKSEDFETTPDLGWYFKKDKGPSLTTGALNGSGSSHPEGGGLHNPLPPQPVTGRS